MAAKKQHCTISCKFHMLSNLISRLSVSGVSYRTTWLTKVEFTVLTGYSNTLIKKNNNNFHFYSTSK